MKLSKIIIISLVLVLICGSSYAFNIEDPNYTSGETLEKVNGENESTEFSKEWTYFGNFVVCTAGGFILLNSAKKDREDLNTGKYEDTGSVEIKSALGAVFIGIGMISLTLLQIEAGKKKNLNLRYIPGVEKNGILLSYNF